MSGRRAADAVAELVSVMDRLRSPGGCPWDAEQTHASLLRYAVEEVHEVVEAVEAGDRAGMREELGDLLLQVVFHARVAQEHPDDPFDLAVVADGITAKLRRRHPHVFGEDVDGGTGGDNGDDRIRDAEDVHERWERLKAAEKRRASALDGVPATLPALARAQKVLGRAARAGLLDGASDATPLGSADGAGAPGSTEGVGPSAPPAADVPEASLGERLLALVAEAERGGADAESVLRNAVRELEGRLRDVERDLGTRPRSGLSPTSPGRQDDAV